MLALQRFLPVLAQPFPFLGRLLGRHIRKPRLALCFPRCTAFCIGLCTSPALASPLTLECLTLRQPSNDARTLCIILPSIAHAFLMPLTRCGIAPRLSHRLRIGPVTSSRQIQPTRPQRAMLRNQPDLPLTQLTRRCLLDHLHTHRVPPITRQPFGHLDSAPVPATMKSHTPLEVLCLANILHAIGKAQLVHHSCGRGLVKISQQLCALRPSWNRGRPPERR